SDQEPTESEVRIMMNLVRAKRDIYRAQKALTDCVMQENEVFASLLKFQAEATEKRLDNTDLGLGCMRVICNMYGWSVPPSHLTRQGGSHSCGGCDAPSVLILVSNSLQEQHWISHMAGPP
ncbi:hypothetical protein CY34DRAFT_101659, partial [Suillus luteus UH-Slu-Lm8-n1]